MTTAFTIDDFSTHFKGGARAYLFRWTPPIISDVDFDVIDDSMLVKSTNFPETTVEEHIIEYQQVNLKIAGKKTYNDWTVAFVVDKEGLIRLNFEKWMNKIHNINSSGSFQQNYYSKYIVGQMTFQMLDYGGVFGVKTGNELLKITLHNVWPKSIGPITLDYSSQDFAQFDVTFSYLYHYMDKSEIPIE